MSHDEGVPSRAGREKLPEEGFLALGRRDQIGEGEGERDE
jgi:hypothetical protein